MGRTFAIAAMLASVTIYGANFALSRHAILNGLTPHDLAALRFLVGGLLLLPLFLRRGALNCAGLGWGKGLALAALSGAPMALLMNTGLSLAPAAHGASLQPGFVTVIGAVGGFLMFRARPSPAVMLGIGVALCGLACIGLASAATGTRSVLVGDLFFIAAGCLWGMYPLLLQRWGVGGLESTTVVAVLSLAIYVPLYLAFFEPRLWSVDPGTIVFHAINQGVFNVVLGLWLWGSAVATLGAATAQRFPPLLPVVGTLAAIPILGEWPGPMQTMGVLLIVSGLGLAAFGDRLLRRVGAPATQP